jgi:multimeric flavodoxin WrbA
MEVEIIRPIDHPIATGVYPDMTEHGWEQDAWPELFETVRAADIIVLAGPIWLGDKSSVTKQVVERLYAMSGMTNEEGQYICYGKVGGALLTGNENGVKHCAMNVLYSLQHIGVTIPRLPTPDGSGPSGRGRVTPTRARAVPRATSRTGTPRS